MIRCESDDPSMAERCEQFAREVLAESNSRAIEDLRIVARMRSGYFIISARLRESPPPSRVSDYGSVESTSEGTTIHIDPAKEAGLPAILAALRTEYGESHVKVLSRFDVSVPDVDAGRVSGIVVVDRERDLIGEVTSLLASIAPEGFRVSRTWSSKRAVTMLSSQHALRRPWLTTAERIQMSWKIE